MSSCKCFTEYRFESCPDYKQITMELINIADIKNPETGKTYREENNAKIHNIPLGTLVEVDFDDSYLENPKKGREYD